MTDYKMIVTDLDRTLLHSDKSVSDYAVSMLAKCRKTGIKVVIATARPERTVTQYLEQISCDGVIYHNGALVNFRGRKSTCPIPLCDAKMLIKYIKSADLGHMLSAEADDTLYANFDASKVWNFTEYVKTDFEKIPDGIIYKIIVGIENEKQAGEIASKIAMQLPDGLYIEVSEGNAALIMNQNASKYNAVKILADKLGIEMNRIVSFGDDWNDLSLIKATYGVAVGNALDEVKAAAKYVTDDNDSDGVAKFIERFIIKECTAV